MDASKQIDGSDLIQQDRSVPVFAGTARHHPLATSSARGYPEFSDLVFACRHHALRTLFVGGVLSTVLVVLAWSTVEPVYRAESLVRVREQQDVVFSALTSRATDTTFFHSQEKLVLSPPVLTATLNHPDVRALAHDIPNQDAADWLKQYLKVDMQSGSEVMSIATLHKSPRLAQAISNALTQAYLDEVTRRHSYDREQRDKKLEQAARDADKRLDELWAELNTVAHSVGSDSSQSLTIRDELQFQAYRDYSQQLRAAQQRGKELQRQLAEQELSKDAESSGMDPLIESQLQKNTDLIAAREQVQNAELQIQQMRQIAARDDAPRLVRLLEQRDLYAAQVDRIIAELKPSIREQLRQQSRKKIDSSIAKMQRQIELNLSEIDALKDRLNEIDTGITRTEDKSGVQLDIHRHAVDRQTRLADGLWQSLQEFRIEGESQPRVTLIRLSELPQQANHSRQFKAAGAAGVVGWLFVTLTIGFLEWRDCRVRSVDDVTAHTAFPVFGSDCVSGGRWLGWKRSRVLSGAREAAARMMLLGQSNHLIPTLMVSSATATESRHWVSLELAQAFRKFNRRTILIDCDTSPAGLSQMLGAEQQRGILQCSESGTDVRRHIIPTEQDGIDFLPVGLGDDANAWIDPQILKSVILSLRRDYPVVIVNGPAVMLSAESLLLAAQVDLVLFSVFLGTSHWNQLAASEQSVIQSGISIGGSILHSGKRPAPLQLMTQRRGQVGQPVPANAAEMELSYQLDEIQNDLRQAQSTPSASDPKTRPHQESST